jgi:hypothetical protein
MVAQALGDGGGLRQENPKFEATLGYTVPGHTGIDSKTLTKIRKKSTILRTLPPK